MPFFQGALRTTTHHSRFNDVAGSQYLTTDERIYGGSDRPTFKTTTQGDAFHGAIHGGNVGGRGNHYDDAARAATGSSTPQQQLNPSASADSDDNDMLLEVLLARTRVEHEASRHKKRADGLVVQLADTKAKLTKVESQLTAAQQELAKYRPGGL